MHLELGLDTRIALEMRNAPQKLDQRLREFFA